MGSNINGGGNHGIQFVLIFKYLSWLLKIGARRKRKIEVLDSYVNGLSFCGAIKVTSYE